MCVAHVALFFVVAGGTGNVGGGGLRVGEIAVCVCVCVFSVLLRRGACLLLRTGWWRTRARGRVRRRHRSPCGRRGPLCRRR